ncbi:hypothetical protein TSAR_000724 [Trichomalopsis sarcophagae]|uniref:MRN complex-interacting protein N-terminal domain-containing protein n=1 Tax=Trichomalopsis sarcophagae TaxID=543379 RepID=A0A232F659_9HYME|nr:hypothetical protein TSAR_000724 [Trichomalopsis sarcophagae]
MPQEAWVLKCYSCNKFQVQLKKNAKKWQCKVCGSKQDLITIYFKGSTSDCRVNVQNMNAAEGELLDKQPEQSDIGDEYCDDDDIENISQNSQNSHNLSFSCEDMDEFSNSVLEADISEPCVKSDEDYFQRIYTENPNEKENGSLASNTDLLKNGPTDTNEYDFDISTIDFTIKTYRESTSSSTDKRNQPLKLSIFESNSNFDESLEF